MDCPSWVCAPNETVHQDSISFLKYSFDAQSIDTEAQSPKEQTYVLEFLPKPVFTVTTGEHMHIPVI